MKRVQKLALTAAFGFAFVLHLSCGELSSGNEDLSSSSVDLQYSSSSLEEGYSSDGSGSDDYPYSYSEGYDIAPSSSSANSSSSEVSSSSAFLSSSSFFLMNSSSGTSTGTSSSSEKIINYGETVVYDGKEYPTVVIGTQTWFAKNLNYNVEGSKCYGEGSINEVLTSSEIQANCNTYGKLYNWEAAMTICPTGWHLPTLEEWNELSDFIQIDKDCSSCDAMHLRADREDSYGFAALLGGHTQYVIAIGTGYFGEEFANIRSHGYWWNATESNSDSAYVRHMGFGNGNSSGWERTSKVYLQSVRCIKDN